MRQHAAERTADKQAQRLRGVVHPHGRALGTRGRDLADQRRQARLKHVEGDEIKRQRHDDTPEISNRRHEDELRRQHERNRGDKNRLEPGPLRRTESAES